MSLPHTLYFTLFSLPSLTVRGEHHLFDKIGINLPLKKSRCFQNLLMEADGGRNPRNRTFP